MNRRSNDAIERLFKLIIETKRSHNIQLQCQTYCNKKLLQIQLKRNHPNK